MKIKSDLTRILSDKELVFLEFLTKSNNKTTLTEREIGLALDLATATIRTIIVELTKLKCISIEKKIQRSDLMGWFDTTVRTISITSEGMEAVSCADPCYY